MFGRVRRLRASRDEWRSICKERKAVIDMYDRAWEGLNSACDDYKALIDAYDRAFEKLSGVCDDLISICERYKSISEVLLCLRKDCFSSYESCFTDDASVTDE